MNTASKPNGQIRTVVPSSLMANVWRTCVLFLFATSSDFCRKPGVKKDAQQLQTGQAADDEVQGTFCRRHVLLHIAFRNVWILAVVRGANVQV